MVAAIFSAIAAIPSILGYIETFANWLTNQINIAKKIKAEQDAAKAVALAKEKKDTSGIDQMFDPTKKG